jgi:hypothetical protein
MQQEPQISQHKKLQMKSRGKDVSVDPSLSAEFLDFLETCNKYDMGFLVKVS